jgi:hypothetical protein
MAGTFNLSSVHVFPCPACKETINTSMEHCSFCGEPIDNAAAEQAAAATSRVSAAVSDASYLKVMAWAILSFFFVMFIPFMGLVGSTGLIFVSYALPVMCIRWWVKYGGIRTEDSDYPGARKIAIVITLIAFFNLVRDLGGRSYTYFHH